MSGHFGTGTDVSIGHFGPEVSRQFGTKALRHFGTKFKENPVPKCLDTSAPSISRLPVSGHFVSHVGPKCPVAEVSGNPIRSSVFRANVQRLPALHDTLATYRPTLISRRGPGNAYFISIRPVSLSVISGILLHSS